MNSCSLRRKHVFFFFMKCIFIRRSVFAGCTLKLKESIQTSKILIYSIYHSNAFRTIKHASFVTFVCWKFCNWTFVMSQSALIPHPAWWKHPWLGVHSTLIEATSWYPHVHPLSSMLGNISFSRKVKSGIFAQEGNQKAKLFSGDL